MPTYGKENFKESNVNYLNKDFASLKESLMNYAKSYFPNTKIANVIRINADKEYFCLFSFFKNADLIAIIKSFKYEN